MKIDISTVRNGLLVKVDADPSPSDPLAQSKDSGTWFAHDTIDLLGRIAEIVKRNYDPIVDRLQKD